MFKTQTMRTFHRQPLGKTDSGALSGTLTKVGTRQTVLFTRPHVFKRVAKIDHRPPHLQTKLAFDRFIAAREPYIKRMAKLMRKAFDIEWDDAVQIVRLAIIEAAKRFDPDRGRSFETYARYWIRQCSRQHCVAYLTSLHFPPSLFWRSWKMRRPYQALIASEGLPIAPDRLDQLASEGGLSREAWDAFCASIESVPFSHLEADQRQELRSRSTTEPPPIASLLEGDWERALVYGLNQLKLREFKVLVARYGLIGTAATLQECGNELGITRERVRQIQAGAEKRLKRLIEAKYPDLIANV